MKIRFGYSKAVDSYWGCVGKYRIHLVKNRIIQRVDGQSGNLISTPQVRLFNWTFTIYKLIH
jgi:hypothetical protein